MAKVLDYINDVVLEAITLVAKAIYIAAMLSIPMFGIWLAIEISTRM